MEAQKMYYMAICDDDKNDLNTIIKIVEKVITVKNISLRFKHIAMLKCWWQILRKENILISY